MDITVSHLSQFLDAHDLYEYEIFIQVTMPNGLQFITDDAKVANKMLNEHGAITKHICRLESD